MSSPSNSINVPQSTTSNISPSKGSLGAFFCSCYFRRKVAQTMNRQNIYTAIVRCYMDLYIRVAFFLRKVSSEDVKACCQCLSIPAKLSMLQTLCRNAQTVIPSITVQAQYLNANEVLAQPTSCLMYYESGRFLPEVPILEFQDEMFHHLLTCISLLH
jgi:hypothetical protein